MSQSATTVDPDEIERFSAMAAAWWDPDGDFRPLHRLNPTRLTYIRDRVAGRLDRDPLEDKPLQGLKLLDIGCGGGLLSEPMARLGAEVTGVDASEKNIGTASAHAREMGLDIDYRHSTAEALAEAGESFDVVLNMEVVEHVADAGLFLRSCADLVRPGGAMVLSTINRTPQAFAMAIVGAEYVLRWLPRGTHTWRKFVRPSELTRHAEGAGLNVEHLTGVSYNPLNDRWTLSRDLSVNYMAFTTKPGTPGPENA